MGAQLCRARALQLHARSRCTDRRAHLLHLVLALFRWWPGRHLTHDAVPLEQSAQPLRHCWQEPCLARKPGPQASQRPLARHLVQPLWAHFLHRPSHLSTYIGAVPSSVEGHAVHSL